jgi:FAD:protein FMN transferase
MVLMNPLPITLKNVFAAKAVRHEQHFEHVLGTTLELQLKARNAQVAQLSETILLAEIERLEQIFSRFVATSELNRLQETQNKSFRLSTELESVLQAALYWQERSNGAFHLGADALGQVWKLAETNNIFPTDTDLAFVVNQLKTPMLQIGAGVATRVSGLPMNLNAIAKGFIAETIAQKAFMVDGIFEVLINLGGDLRHCGTNPISVSIANPFSNADNALPLEKIRLCNQGLATSGGSYRGYTIAGSRVSHLLDPRSGQPVKNIICASVIAPDAMTADVLATIFSVFTPEQSLEFANALPKIGCCLVSQNKVIRNEFWQAQIV